MSHGKLEKRIIILIRRRLIASYINLIIFPLLTISPLFILMYLGDIQEISWFWIIIAIVFAFIFQFGTFVVLTNGYTIGGLLTGVKIKKLDGTKLTLLETLKRFLNAWNCQLKFKLFTRTKVNTLGQFYYDKKFNTTVIRPGVEISKYPKVYDIEYNYLKELLMFFAVLAFLSNFLSWLFK